MNYAKHQAAPDLPLLSIGMGALLLAQFFSALADNALLIAAIAIAKSSGLPKLVPLLQEAFVLPFILLAPWSGPIADAYPKGRVMLLANLMKLGGASVMALGANPLLAYGVVGIGATIYSPAKYGILTQMFGPQRLVRANGMLEGSTIVAILLGVLLGGCLADYSLTWAFTGTITAYALATAANLRIPHLAAENPATDFRLRQLLGRFGGALRTLFADPDARFSLMGTGVFWGSGTTLRLVLFAWVPAALLLNDNATPAKLMGVVSIGIVGGAAAAGAWISLAKVDRALIGGALLGPLILALSAVGSMPAAVLTMAGIGLSGGLFVVPLNALLQARGHDSVGAGSALAVQNFSENLVMLLFVGGYWLASAAGVSVTHTVLGFGAIMVVTVLAVCALRLRQRTQPT